MLATKSNIKLALSLNPDILHICSHGEENHLVFEQGYNDDENGQQEQSKFSDVYQMTIDELQEIFAEHESNFGSSKKLKLVYLSCCKSHLIAKMLNQTNVSHVVCSSKEVLESAAKRHTAPFYSSLVDGDPMCLAHKRAIH